MHVRVPARFVVHRRHHHAGLCRRRRRNAVLQPPKPLQKYCAPSMCRHVNMSSGQRRHFVHRVSTVLFGWLGICVHHDMRVQTRFMPHHSQVFFTIARNSIRWKRAYRQNCMSKLWRSCAHPMNDARGEAWARTTLRPMCAKKFSLHTPTLHTTMGKRSKEQKLRAEPVEPELPLGKYLASTEKHVRDRAIRSLAAFLLKSSKEDGLVLSPSEMSKLWKGIFYCTSP